jgi:hypothetical protein
MRPLSVTVLEGHSASERNPHTIPELKTLNDSETAAISTTDLTKVLNNIGLRLRHSHNLRRHHMEHSLMHRQVPRVCRTIYESLIILRSIKQELYKFKVSDGKRNLHLFQNLAQVLAILTVFWCF